MKTLPSLSSQTCTSGLRLFKHLTTPRPGHIPYAIRSEAFNVIMPHYSFITSRNIYHSYSVSCGFSFTIIVIIIIIINNNIIIIVNTTTITIIIIYIFIMVVLISETMIIMSIIARGRGIVLYPDTSDYHDNKSFNEHILISSIYTSVMPSR